MKRTSLLKSLSLLLATSLHASVAMADPVSWTDWSSITTGLSGSGTGSMTFGSTTVGVSLSGLLDGFDNGTTYFSGYPATYSSHNPSDLIQEWHSGTVTLTFSKPVTDLHLALVSVGQGGWPVTYSFDRSFTVVSSGPNAWGYSGYSISGNSFTGYEYNGILEFSGTVSSLSFSVSPGEFWHGFNIGAVAAVPEPETWALMLAGLGLMGFVARRRKHQI